MALIGAGVVLFAQVAMAAHVCMGEAPAQAMSAALAADSQGAPCHQAEPDGGGALNACIAHCQAGAPQAFDNSFSPSAMPMATLAYFVDWRDFLPASLSAQDLTQAPLTRAAAPPTRVRNCCLRI